MGRSAKVHVIEKPTIVEVSLNGAQVAYLDDLTDIIGETREEKVRFMLADFAMRYTPERMYKRPG